VGATRGDVPKMVVGQSLSVVAAGVAIGPVASIGISRAITTLLFNVSRESIRLLAARKKLGLKSGEPNDLFLLPRI
jgi:ABC-type antimicrobial peptide transport system permease subunit